MAFHELTNFGNHTLLAEAVKDFPDSIGGTETSPPGDRNSKEFAAIFKTHYKEGFLTQDLWTHWESTDGFQRV